MATTRFETSQMNAQDYLARGLTELRKPTGQNLGRTIADFSQAIELSPQYAQAYYYRGVARRRMKDFVGAIDDFTKTIALAPGRSAPYRNRGKARRQMKDFTGAIADFSKEIELAPGRAGGYIRRGKIRNRQGDAIGAILDFTKAIKLDPERPDSYKERNIVCRQQAEDDLAKAKKLEKRKKSDSPGLFSGEEEFQS